MTLSLDNRGNSSFAIFQVQAVTSFFFGEIFSFFRFGRTHYEGTARVENEKKNKTKRKKKKKRKTKNKTKKETKIDATERFSESFSSRRKCRMTEASVGFGDPPAPAVVRRPVVVVDDDDDDDNDDDDDEHDWS